MAQKPVKKALDTFNCVLISLNIFNLLF